MGTYKGTDKNNFNNERDIAVHANSLSVMLEQLDELKDLQQRLVTSQTHKGSIRLPQHKEEFVALLEKAVIGQVLTDHCLRAFFLLCI